MTLKQKITRIIILLSVLVAITIPCLFHSSLYPFFLKFFATKLKLVSNKDKLLVHFIDVEQADAAAINLPDGKIMLIDTGTKELNIGYVNYIKENVLNTKRNNYIDYLILSHAHTDHVGGALKLLKTFNVGKVFVPKVYSSTNTYVELLDYIEDNCNYDYLGDEYEISNSLYEIKFFEILVDSNLNDSSQVIKLTYNNTSFLFTGDITEKAERQYINVYGDMLDCDVLKVAHHGSKGSSSEEFLDVATPDYAVISVGFGNEYGHPTYDALTRLTEVGAKILRTDKKDNILFVVDDACGLINVNGNYYVTGLSLDYSVLILIIDGCLIYACVVISIKTNKKKRKRKKRSESK